LAVPQPGGGPRRMAPPPASGRQHVLRPTVVPGQSGLSWAVSDPF
jgi:hypothetical protein